MQDRTPIPIEKKSSEMLAAMVVAHKALGVQEDQAILAMEELMKRKSTGDTFDFHKFIDDELAKLPKVKDETPYANILQQIISYVK